jgi:hypothetical protein
MIAITVAIVISPTLGIAFRYFNQIAFLLTCQSQAEAVIVVAYEVLQRGATIALRRRFSAFMNRKRFLERHHCQLIHRFGDSLKVTTILVDTTWPRDLVEA